MTTIDNLFQALSLDLSILEVLLKRHRCSHGRAIYFQRISMVLRATQRFNLLGTGELLERFERNSSEYSQQQKRKRNRSKDDDHWDSRGGLLNDEQSKLKNDYEELEQLYTVSFAEILSRIDHASAPLFLEVSRGFFLPFCTVALGALARVRTLLLRMGRYGLSQLQELISSDEHLRKFISFSKHMFEATMAKYLEEDKSGERTSVGVGMVSNRERRPNLVKSLGYSIPKQQFNSGTDGSISEKVDSVRKDTEDIPYDDQKKLVSYESQTEKPEGITTSQSASLAAAEEDEDDIGESLAFSGGAVNTTFADTGTVSTSTAQLTMDQLDRNMELVANFKNKGNKRGSEKRGGDKKSKKRKDNETPPAPEKKTKKKKKKGKGDFFDALFD
jgi:hypothetical protein